VDTMTELFGSLSGYGGGAFHDELVDGDGAPRPAARETVARLQSLTLEELRQRQKAAEIDISSSGITFSLYSEGSGNIDRAWPFDVIPRIFSAAEWNHIEAGLAQRLRALNLFIDDLYHGQRALNDGIVPRELLESSPGWRPECVGVDPAHRVWAHICGSDLVRDADGTVYVLEDNLRVPSGVSYMLENRVVTKRVFAELFEKQSIRPVDRYPDDLLATLRSLSPAADPTVVVLTPGVHNSAYFEHSFLAMSMGVELAEGPDLSVRDDVVYLRTIEGPRRVDVIYRRLDDAFLDPEVFRPDSALGVAGLMRAWRKGNVAIANAPGTGVADDKAVYCFVPDLIRYFLDEEPILANVPTWRCEQPSHLSHVLANLEQLVVKPTNEAGGKDLLIGPHATAAQVEAYRDRLRADPRGWVAQPMLSLSVAPTLTPDGVEPRHLDLRPFVLQGAVTRVTAGGLTRVALRKGSLVVNSSQGGGSKDTWIVEND
jgi:uncharacterized circularly permuted ATP-grasp superfamily protein